MVIEAYANETHRDNIFVSSGLTRGPIPRHAPRNLPSSISPAPFASLRRTAARAQPHHRPIRAGTHRTLLCWRARHAVMIDGRRQTKLALAAKCISCPILLRGTIVVSPDAGNRKERRGSAPPRQVAGFTSPLGSNTSPTSGARRETFFTSDGKEVWVVVRGENYVAVLDGATYQEKTRIVVASRPGMTIFSPDGKYGYVCSPFTPEPRSSPSPITRS